MAMRVRDLELSTGYGEPMSRVYDVIVIGATVSGLTSAVALARRGMKVIVLDPNRAGGSAAIGHGLMTLSTGDLIQLADSSKDLVAARIRGLQLARAFVTNLIAEAEVAHLRLPLAERSLSPSPDLDIEQRLLGANGVAATSSTDQPLSGVRLAPGWSVGDQIAVDPVAYSHGLNDLALSSGVQILTDVTVTRFRFHQVMHAVQYRSQLAWEQNVLTVWAPRVIDTQGISPWGLQARLGEPLVAPVVVAEGPQLRTALAIRDAPARLIRPWQDRVLIVGHPVPDPALQAAKVGLSHWVSSVLRMEVTQTAAFGVESPNDEAQEGASDIHGALWAGGNGLWELASGTAAGLKLAQLLLDAEGKGQRLPAVSRLRALVSRSLG